MTHIVVAVPSESEGMARAFFVPTDSARANDRVYRDGWCAHCNEYSPRPVPKPDPPIKYDYSDQLRLPDIEPFLAAVHENLVRFTVSLRELRHGIERAEVSKRACC